MSANNLIPAGTTLLPCGCVVPSETGRLVGCPEGHPRETPDHFRPAPKPRGH